MLLTYLRSCSRRCLRWRRCRRHHLSCGSAHHLFILPDSLKQKPPVFSDGFQAILKLVHCLCSFTPVGISFHSSTPLLYLLPPIPLQCPPSSHPSALPSFFSSPYPALLLPIPIPRPPSSHIPASTLLIMFILFVQTFFLG